ncbi:hypothetical protein ACFXK0_26735 [Nocardia sp. NPDC059177]|uniref:hypothetical protein n=1 Tax=Nocardia sp. NPDC059177 TaxID=3346759 RepID=UPI003675C21A
MNSPIFSAEPTHISGIGGLADELSTVMMHVSSLAKLGSISESVGIMQILDDPINQFAEITGQRLQSRMTTLSETGYNLRRAAWIYQNTDQNWSEALANADAHTKVPDTGAPSGASITPDGSSPRKEVDEYPGSIPYPANDIPDLTAPPKGESDIRSVIDSTSGMLKDIDSGIKDITGWAGVNNGDGWSPLEELIKPISGKHR